MIRSKPSFSLCSAVLAAAVTLSLPAQDVRENNAITSWGWYYGTTAATLDGVAAQGYRITDIEVESTSPLRFTAALVRNTGTYQSGWWWYYGLTAAQVGNYLSQNSARLIDLEPYEENGSTRFACVMVPNTGQNAKPWWYLYGTSGATIATTLSQNNARLVDLDSYEIGGNTYYSAVMIANTGADQRQWAWYYNVPIATVQASVANGRRVYDLERRGNGNYNAILINDPTPQHWTWWYGIDAATASWVWQQYGHRIYDIQTYFVGNERRFAICTINNSNALTTQVGDLMRNTTDGTVGCYLRQLGGSELAGLNENTRFEPASTMKTLHHVHAMRRVALGAVSLNTQLTVFTGTSGSCPLDTNPVQESLTTVLRAMMEQSDNNRTQAVAAYFGTANLNATAAALGMADTSLNHRIGCAGPAIQNPNQITLVDLYRLHDQVRNGYLGSFRDEFYEHMLNGLGWGGISTIIDQEAASLALGAPTVTAFKAAMALAQKGGSYTLISNNVTQEHRAGFGYVRIPFVQGGQAQDREYAVGAFVNGASNGTNAGNAVSQAVGEMLRPTLRAALMTWDITAVSASYGAGCGGLLHTASAAPRIGTTYTMNLSGAQPNTLAVLAIGFSDQYHGRTRLPFELSGAGAPGCFALCSLDGTQTTVTNGSGQASRSLAIPASPTWLGTEFYTQFYGFGSQLRTSNGRHAVIGG